MSEYPYPTTQDTAELIALKEKINKLSPPARLRLAAELLERGKLPLAETIAGQVVTELQILRMQGKVKS